MESQNQQLDGNRSAGIRQSVWLMLIQLPIRQEYYAMLSVQSFRYEKYIAWKSKRPVAGTFCLSAIANVQLQPSLSMRG